MHLISKNWEDVFDFQYEVAIGQCEFVWAAVKVGTYQLTFAFL